MHKIRKIRDRYCLLLPVHLPKLVVKQRGIRTLLNVSQELVCWKAEQNIRMICGVAQ